MIINIYKLCSLFSASVGLYTFGDRLNVVDRCDNIIPDIPITASIGD